MLTFLFDRLPRLALRGRVRSRRQHRGDVHAWLCPSCDIWDDEETLVG